MLRTHCTAGGKGRTFEADTCIHGISDPDQMTKIYYHLQSLGFMGHAGVGCQ